MVSVSMGEKRIGEILNIAQIGTWYYFLNKRLLKRVEFVIMLCLLPLLVFGVSIGAKQEKGILHILLLTEQNPDADANSVIKDLTTQESIIRFSVMDDEFLAKQMLIKQEADAIWSIPNNLETDITNYVQKKQAFIHVYQSKEDTVLNLSKEILFRSLYPRIAYHQYLDFMGEKIHALYTGGDVKASTGLSAEQIKELESYHKLADADDSFLEFLTLDGTKEVKEDKRVDYLLSPMRGMLAVWLFVGIVIANIYHMQDEKNGLFDFLDRGRRNTLSLVYKISVSINLLLLMHLMLWMVGQTVDFGKEIMAAILLYLSLLLLGEMFRNLFPSPYILAAILFPCSIYCIISAPIFLDLRLGGLSMLSLGNPIYHYLGLISDISCLRGFLYYIIVSAILLGMMKLWSKKSIFT